MLRRTFVHLPNVGPVTEKAIWDAGLATWDDFISSSSLPSRVWGRRAELSRRLEECRVRLNARDGAYFESCLPRRELWRLYGDFRDRAAFLDIETTGLSPEYSYVTMVGILDSQGYTPYVRDENLEDLRAALEGYDLIVTYNGASFDLPYLEYHFGRLFAHTAHLDLRFPLRRLGYGGGLKAIEGRLQVGRVSELAGLSGYDAVLLWRMWQGGDTGARDTLIRYNAEDVVSLPALADIVYNTLLARLPVPQSPIEHRPRPVPDLPYDPDVVRRLTASRPLGWAAR